MARERGTFDFSANFEVKKEGSIDARQLVDDFSDLLNFTSDDYIPKGFIVSVKNDATIGGTVYEGGVYRCIDHENLSDPSSWEIVGGKGLSDENYQPIAFNPTLKVDKLYLSAGSNRVNQTQDITLSVDDTDAIVGGGGVFELESDGSYIELSSDFSTVHAPDSAVINFSTIILEEGLYNVHYFWDGSKMKLSFHEIKSVLTDIYCKPNPFNIIEPITLVNVAGINNSSSAVINGSPEIEDFRHIVGTMVLGDTYGVELEGNTNGNFNATFTVFIDWEHTGTFDGSEDRYEIDTIHSSTGVDGKKAIGVITVPANAILGQTRMRVVKLYGAAYAPDACAHGGVFGQIEDYTINVTT